MWEVSLFWWILLFVLWFVVMFTFTLFWGHGTILRAILFFFWVPADIAISSLLTSSIASRGTSLFVLYQKNFINWKISGLMIGVSTISWIITTYLLLIIDSTLIEFFVWLMLIGWALWYIIKKVFPLKTHFDIQIPKKYTPFIQPFNLLIILISDTLATITGWVGLISIIILKKYFWLSFQEAAAAHKIGGIFKSIIVAWWLIIAGKYSIPLLAILIPAGALGAYFWTHYFSDKSDTTIEKIMFVISLIMWGYLLWKSMAWF